MEDTQEGLPDIISRRLIAQIDDAGTFDVDEKLNSGHPPTTEENTTAMNASSDKDTATEITPAETHVPQAFAKVEKSLISLGFFTPSSRRIKDQKMKRISFTRSIEGKKVEATAEFHPSAVFGLPITADQDKFLALQEIITSQLQSSEKISNPIRFTSAELLRLLNKRVRTGKNYKDIGEWLDVMTATTIVSNGVVYEAGKKRFARDRFHVFERAVNVGKEMPDGSVADANYVWLSEWQLENINQNFLLPIDLYTYRELKNHIAKALVPLLQVWLFASQRAGSFEKRYDELCEMLGLQTFKAPSLITRQLRPSLDELTKYEYLEKWRIEKTSDRKSYKIIFFHGPKFHRDRRRRLDQKHQFEPPVVIAESNAEPELPEPGRLEAESVSSTGTSADTPKTPTTRTRKREEKSAIAPTNEPQVVPAPNPQPVARRTLTDPETAIVRELTDRGVMQSNAVDLVYTLPGDRLATASDYIDYWDSIRPDPERGKGPGLLVHLIQNGDPLPQWFETRRKRAERLVAEKRRENFRMIKQILTSEYEEYCRAVVERYITEQLGSVEFERRVADHKASMSRQSEFWAERMSPELLDQVARHSVSVEIGKTVTVMPYEDYRKREMPRLLTELKIDPAELGLDSAGQWIDISHPTG